MGLKELAHKECRENAGKNTPGDGVSCFWEARNGCWASLPPLGVTTGSLLVKVKIQSRGRSAKNTRGTQVSLSTHIRSLKQRKKTP